MAKFFSSRRMGRLAWSAIWLCSFLPLSVFFLPVQANQEQYWQQALQGKIHPGKTVWLKAGQTRFLGIYTPYRNKKHYGAAIILHDKDMHPDWAQVIHPLRTGLADHGWNTLSVQMPITQKNLSQIKELKAFYDKARQRIDAAIAFLSSKKQTPIFLIGYGQGSSMLLYYTLKNKDFFSAKNKAAVSRFIPVAGLVIISNQSLMIDKHPRNSAAIINQLYIPLLDIYGSYDLDAVVQSAPQRRAAGHRSMNPDYQQEIILHADHFFQRNQDALIKRIYAWMRKIIRKPKQ